MLQRLRFAYVQPGGKKLPSGQRAAPEGEEACPCGVDGEESEGTSLCENARSRSEGVFSAKKR